MKIYSCTFISGKFENICNQLDAIQQEADLFYHQLHGELLSSMEGKRNEKSQFNFTIIEEYISGIREIFIMFKKEYYRYEDLFQNELNYLGKSLEQIKDVYRKYSTHQYIKIHRGEFYIHYILYENCSS